MKKLGLFNISGQYKVEYIVLILNMQLWKVTDCNCYYLFRIIAVVI